MDLRSVSFIRRAQMEYFPIFSFYCARTPVGWLSVTHPASQPASASLLFSTIENISLLYLSNEKRL